MRIGIVGGTGPQGRGLAARWARAGHHVTLGSRELTRARDAARATTTRAGHAVHGHDNAGAVAAADVVVVAVPYDAQVRVLPPLRAAVGDRVVCNVVNPLAFDERGAVAVDVEEGSAAEQNALLWPRARMVSGFHDVSARRLLRVAEPVDGHVLLCGDDPAALHLVGRLARDVPGMVPVTAGPLRNSRHLEHLACVLLAVNRVYRTQSGVLVDARARS